MTWEVAWTRLLALVLGSSVYAFSVMLATFLAGLAAGAALGTRWAAGTTEPRAALRRLGAVLAVGALAGYATLHVLPALPATYAAAFHGLGLADEGAGLAGRAVRLVALEFAVAGVVMLPAAVCAGMVFPLALGIAVGDPRRIGRTVGALSAASTAGMIAGAAVAGVVLLPLAGLQGSLLAAVAAGLFLAAVVRGRGARRSGGRRGLAAAGAGVLAAVLVAARPPWEPLVMNSGVFQYAPELGVGARTRDGFRAAQQDDTEVLFYEEGLTANVLVARQRSTDNVWLSIDGKIDASSRSDLATQLLLGHLPMVWRGAGQDDARAAVIGYASGITTGAVTRHAPARVAAVEIEPAVIRASVLFDDVNHRPFDDPAVRLVETDGRTFLAAEGDPYDVIVSEPSNPWMTIAANLFTREFFEAGRGRLAPGGVFSQWIQLYGMRPEDLRSLVATFAAVFPRVAVFWGIPGRDLVLLGSDAALDVDVERLEATLARAPVAADLARVDIRGVEDLLAFYLTDDAGRAGVRGRRAAQHGRQRAHRVPGPAQPARRHPIRQRRRSRAVCGRPPGRRREPGARRGAAGRALRRAGTCLLPAGDVRAGGGVAARGGGPPADRNRRAAPRELRTRAAGGGAAAVVGDAQRPSAGLAASPCGPRPPPSMRGGVRRGRPRRVACTGLAGTGQPHEFATDLVQAPGQPVIVRVLVG